MVLFAGSLQNKEILGTQKHHHGEKHNRSKALEILLISISTPILTSANTNTNRYKHNISKYR
jgi:hypothetical protein